MCCSGLNRREFVGITTAGIAGGVLGLASSSMAEGVMEDWNPEAPYRRRGKPLKVQPILMYRIPTRREATSWKSWGGIQTEQAVAEEVQRITRELQSLAAQATFPLDILPVIKVKSTAEAAAVHQKDYDVVVVYPPTGSGDMLKACFARKKDKDTIIFVRHRSGPIYYWYEALSVKYLKTGKNEAAPNSYQDHGGVYIHDAVVDDPQELLWRFRALYGLKNFIGARIVALGGAGGKYDSNAPRAAREKYRLEIIEVSYPEATQRIQSALSDSKLREKATAWAERYLTLPHTTLVTDKKFLVNSFILYHVFKGLLRDHNASAFTILSCMSRIIPIAQTTPCLTLSLLNDEGLLAFCESDFVIIPAGMFMHAIAGTPVFLHNSTFPHKGVATCAHCSAPRRMDGKRYEPVRVLTHYESEYGAAPKVEIPIGQEVTFIDPEYSTGRWLGFKGIVKSNPHYEICRSQQDVEIQGDWKQLLAEARDSHWMMAYGDTLRELQYAARKIGIDWVEI